MLVRWCLEFGGTIIYFCLICGTGMPIVRRFNLKPADIFVGSFIIGSVLLGGVLYALAQLHYINYVFLLSLLLIAGAITSFQIRHIIFFSKSFFFPNKTICFWRKKGRYSFFSVYDRYLRMVSIACGYAPPFGRCHEIPSSTTQGYCFT